MGIVLGVVCRQSCITLLWSLLQVSVREVIGCRGGCVLLSVCILQVDCGAASIRGHSYILRFSFICQVSWGSVPSGSWIVMQTMGLNCLEWAINRSRAWVMQSGA